MFQGKKTQRTHFDLLCHRHDVVGSFGNGAGVVLGAGREDPGAQRKKRVVAAVCCLCGVIVVCWAIHGDEAQERPESNAKTITRAASHCDLRAD